ncbi:Aminodeoxychorismate synthase [Pleurostoma richardsiae]|uniref:aminodeoxychorismate synthase n=1 Tax=Pleurostoma richardsiae TaxID=41990 RepID=A0AA38RG72_9PEZI|nr:Aminodeoxychorismate synthase [Pleurostoma richardsiae]
MAPRHRILFLDAYDSFTNNITALLATLLEVDVYVLPIDTPLLDPASPAFRDDLRRELAHYAAVVCGPGPGSPDLDGDVGLMRHVWDLNGEGLLPALGVCLGFQSLALSCGGRIRRLHRGLHGMVRRIEHRGRGGGRASAGDVFGGVGEFKATLYHSLCVDVGQDSIPEREWSEGKWESPEGCSDIVPLAWVEEEHDGESESERILMAMRHVEKALWGLQYHPESVCTEQEGNRVICNWFREALRWNEATGRNVLLDDDLLARNAVTPSLLHQAAETDGGSARDSSGLWGAFGVGARFCSRTIDLPDNVHVPDIVEMLQARETECIVLDSANAKVTLPETAADVRGRYSIIALDVPEAVRLEHHVGDKAVTVRLPRLGGLPVDIVETVPLRSGQDVWQLVAQFHDARRVNPEDHPDVPFLGGFMGYITYEQGLSGIGVKFAAERGHNRPDVCLVWVMKSIVVDHKENLLHIQYLQPPTANGQNWLDTVAAKLQSSHIWQHSSCDTRPGVEKPRTSSLASRASTGKIQKPDEAEYEAKVRQCQEFIAAGDSYELCLTDQTTITRPRSDSSSAKPSATTDAIRIAHKRRRTSSYKKTPASSWDLYRALCTLQPAPFASYLRLGGATLLSSSPERFLRLDRSGTCSMKPMKGTVRKSDAVRTLARAEELLRVPKEEAENLMIVDLVRHDLHGVCGPGNVAVRDLLRVEEYQSVFQMVTVVEGRLPGEAQEGAGRYTGLDVLAASLPPGSMTGAPKKRSCEILLGIEGDRERSLYSGVVGYMCVSGRGDWSVTIRSMFRWDDECEGLSPDGEPQEVWHIGAGGAVTILSTPEGESEEMFTKLAGPLGVFTES